jgi:hypothetical protein
VIGRSTSKALGHRENRLVDGITTWVVLSKVTGARAGIPDDIHMSDIWYIGGSTDKRVSLTEIFVAIQIIEYSHTSTICKKQHFNV